MKKKTIALTVINVLTALIAVLGICCLGAVPATAADIPSPAVTDGAGLTCADGGVTVISEPADVFVSLEPDTSYYYLINDFDPVDVHYNGVTDNPAGSYFDGPLTNGVYVVTIGANVDKHAGTPVSAASAGRITIPAQSSVLTIIACKGDMTSEIYRHVFRLFKVESADGKFTATVDTGKEKTALDFGLYIGVYNARGALTYLDFVNLSASGSLATDVSAYPLGEYKYRAFWWNKSFVPLGKEKSFE
jgi:hypothetical protein